jgi:hypothetical protein
LSRRGNRFGTGVDHPEENASPGETVGGGRMEIVITTGRRIIVGSDVDARALARVVAVLEKR